jgi:hypothetical protein
MPALQGEQTTMLVMRRVSVPVVCQAVDDGWALEVVALAQGVHLGSACISQVGYEPQVSCCLPVPLLHSLLALWLKGLMLQENSKIKTQG